MIKHLHTRTSLGPADVKVMMLLLDARPVLVSLCNFNFYLLCVVLTVYMKAKRCIFRKVTSSNFKKVSVNSFTPP